jgi:isocitrate/isopropylmalate dehydrogenase
MGESYVIGVLGGDGVGPEVTAEAVDVLRRVGELRGIDFDFHAGYWAVARTRRTGHHCPTRR